jgi:hypothetical protein
VDGQVSFPVTAKAARVRLLDAAELLPLVKGLSVADAEAALAEYGEIDVNTWPDWVSSVPTMDSRVTISIVGQTTESAPTDDPADGSEPDATEAPSAS